MTASGASDKKYEFSPLEFQRFRDFLQNACGIDLGRNKQYLVATRIRPIMRDNRLGNLTALLDRIEEAADRRLRQQVIDAMTTNETFWFRDTYPFEFMAESLLSSVQVQKGNMPIRIWSAACSSGQEPYSISIMVEETIRDRCGRFNTPVEIMATDVSASVLAQARTGQYDQLSLARGLSEERLRKFFRPVGDNRWQVNLPVRSRVDFRPLNLQDSYFFLGKFDIVFCRNVLIYFSTPLKYEILRKIRSVMAPGGHLFLGSSESLGGADEFFDVVHCNPGVAYIAR
jgi:chemotaxis protein methyltransferase CheR